jgi:hypothetical protein
MSAPHATPRARVKLPELEPPAARRFDPVGRGLEHCCSVNACRVCSSGPVATNEQKAHRQTIGRSRWRLGKRPRYPAEHWQNVAETYQRAYEAGCPPTLKVPEFQGQLLDSR